MTKRAIAAAKETRSSQPSDERAMIEFFTVPSGEEDAFRAAWTQAAAVGATLHRALREDAQPRFAALSDPGGPDAGVLLLVEFDSDPALWEPVFERWTPRQGFIGARLDEGV